MFKVNLLPESYRKRLENKRKTNLIISVALVFFLCALIVYSGFAVRLLILQGQLKSAKRANQAVVNQIAELQQYKGIYDELVNAQTRVEAIKPRSPSAVKFLSLVQSERPQYIKINSIAIQDWSKSAICVIDGELSAAQTIGDAVDQLREYANSFKTNSAYDGKVAEVKILNDMPIVSRDADGVELYAFRLFVSLSGTINISDSGTIEITTETTTVSTTASSSESTTASGSTTTESASESTTDK